MQNLKRGNHILPYQSQILGRDLHFEEILKNQNKECHAFRRSPEQMKKDNSENEFVIFAPGNTTQNWITFKNVLDFYDFLQAYGLKVDRHLDEIPPGSQFKLIIPRKLLIYSKQKNL